MPLILVRHCQTTGQAPESELTALGRTQAGELAVFLAGFNIDHIVTSPYQRARDSIAPFAELRDLCPVIDDRLAERRLADTDLPHWRDVVQRAFVDLDHVEPGGESGRETLIRGWAAIHDAATAGKELPVVVGHGHLFGLVLHSIDPAFGFAGHAAMTNPDVFLLEDEPWRFVRLWRTHG